MTSLFCRRTELDSEGNWTSTRRLKVCTALMKFLWKRLKNTRWVDGEKSVMKKIFKAIFQEVFKVVAPK